MPKKIDPNAPAYIGPSRVIDNPDEIDWHDQTDVLIIGYGGAGVCAALEAKAQDVDVLAVDRFDGGGATRLCGGIYYGGATSFQREAGYDDTAENMYAYLKSEVGDAVKESTLRRFCDESFSNMQWLMSHGVQFGSKVFKDKIAYPPTHYDLYFSGNEVNPPHCDLAVPAPRGHRVVGDGFTGHEFFDALQRSASSKGVRLQEHCRVNNLLLGTNGEVIGVEASLLRPNTKARRKHQKIINAMKTSRRYFLGNLEKAAEQAYAVEEQGAELICIRARKAVIIATGSHAANRPMVESHAPRYAGYLANGTISCDGSGIGLGQSVGAATAYLDSVTAWRMISPPLEFVSGILVNKLGQRFVSEDAYVGRIGHEMAQQPESKAWLIIDKAMYWSAYRYILPRKGVSWMSISGSILLNLLFNTVRGSDAVTLAARCGIDPNGLKKTLGDYNVGAQQKDDDFAKQNHYLHRLEKGPFYAIDMSIGNKKNVCAAIPMGGLRVNEETGQVVDEEQLGIAGLYAAGRGVVGIPSGFYVSGSAVADCVFSGRRAGLHAAGQ
jgi:3-oxo-5alpha-steroid 4-dehydrogenase